MGAVVLRTALSMSVPVRLMGALSVSSTTVTVWLFAVGASLTGLTVTETVAVPAPLLASTPRTPKVSLPKKFGFGT
jgi:hypothetical protein